MGTNVRFKGLEGRHSGSEYMSRLTEAKTPVIVLGMHRSGTSLLTRILRQHGIFMGASRDEHEESRLHQRLNKWLLSQASGRWDIIPNPGDLSQDSPLFSSVYDRTIAFLNSPLRYLYLPLQSVIGSWPPEPGWGWKDPRNTLTLPLWLAIYPDAKVVSIRRHGVDVAVSLRQRERKRLESANARTGMQLWLELLTPRERGLVRSASALSLDKGFRLWDDYLQYEEEVANTYGIDICRVKYEELLERPIPEVERILQAISADSIEVNTSVLEDINPDRAYAYRENSAFIEFADRQQDTLRRNGYAY